MIERPFKCPECEFSDHTSEITYQLTFHFNFHTGDLPYQKVYIVLIFEFTFIFICYEYCILLEKTIFQECIFLNLRIQVNIFKGDISTLWFLLSFKFYSCTYHARVILLQLYFILEIISLFYILRIKKLSKIFVLYRNALEDLLQAYPIESLFTCFEYEYNYNHTGELPCQYHINSLISQNDLYHNIAFYYIIYYIKVQRISYSNFSVKAYYYFQINIYVFRISILIYNDKVEKLRFLHIMQHVFYNLMIFYRINGSKPLHFTLQWTKALNANIDNQIIFYGNIFYVFCLYHKSTLYVRKFNWFGLLCFLIHTFFINIIKFWFKIANLLNLFTSFREINSYIKCVYKIVRLFLILFILVVYTFFTEYFKAFYMLMYYPYSVFLTPFVFEIDLKYIYILIHHLFKRNIQLFILKRAEIIVYLSINNHYIYHKNYVTSLHTS